MSGVPCTLCGQSDIRLGAGEKAQHNDRPPLVINGGASALQHESRQSVILSWGPGYKKNRRKTSSPSVSSNLTSITELGLRDTSAAHRVPIR